jgi:hypothetical protein
MEEFLNEVRAHSFFPPKFPSIQRRPKAETMSSPGIRDRIKVNILFAEYSTCKFKFVSNFDSTSCGGHQCVVPGSGLRTVDGGT